MVTAPNRSPNSLAEPSRLRCLDDLDRLAAARTDRERSARFHAGEAKIDLASMERVDAALGHPLQGTPVVHVAGSKGKGSVAAIVESLALASGWRAATYLSPHVDTWNERLRLDGRPCPPDRFLRAVEDARAAAGPASFFELLTGAAFLEMSRSSIDLAIVEVGIGGRLDATNVVSPTVSVLTSIELEHTAVLGSTLSEIAQEKAGIIKPDRPVVSAIPSNSLAASVIAQTARERSAPLQLIGRDFRARRQGDRFHWWGPTGRRPRLPIPAGGPYAVRNAATALAAFDLVQESVGQAASEAAIQRGLEQVELSGRFERIGDQPATYRDGAHTPRSLAATVRWLAERHPSEPRAAILGLQGDKPLRRCVRALAGHVDHLIATRVPGGRAAEPSAIAEVARAMEIPATVEEDPLGALEAARRTVGTRGAVVVLGSFWLAGSIQRAEESSAG